MAGLASIGGKLLGAGLNKAFGDNPRFPGSPGIPALKVDTGNFRLQSFDSGDITLERLGSIGQGLTATEIPRLFGDLKTLQGELRPGFGLFTDAAVQAVNNARQRTIGNLRADLARRRVLGSSFGQNTLAQAEAEFGQKEAEVRAQSLLAEIQATQNVIKTQFDAIQTQVTNELAELGLSGNFASALARGMQAAQSVFLQAKANEVMARRAGSAKFWGDIGGDIFGSGSLFSGGSGLSAGNNIDPGMDF